jgi:hypothetical protein
MSITIEPTTTIPRIQPIRNAGALVLAFGVNSITITAAIGTGLTATPITSTTPIRSTAWVDSTYDVHRVDSTTQVSDD